MFGKSRSTSFVVAFLMIQNDWRAMDALKHVRQRRNVQLNPGFLQQIADLDYKLEWAREKTKTLGCKAAAAADRGAGEKVRTAA